MIRLYRAGRQTEALQAFQRARKTLTVEFGLEPGPELVELERAILDHDSRLNAPDFAIRAPERVGPVEFQRRARSLFDHGDRDAAIHLLDEAIADARERDGDPRTTGDACADLAAYLAAQGDWPRAAEAVGDAVRIARAVDDPALFARAALVAAGDAWVTGLDPVGPPVALLQEALDRLPSAPTPLRARLHARLAVARSHSHPGDVTAADSAEAMRLANMLGDPETLAVAIHSQLVVDQDVAHLEPRRAAALTLLRLANENDHLRWRAWALPALARVEALRGEIAQAEQNFDELDKIADELDDPVARWHAKYGDVLRTTVAGDYAGALRALERVRDAGVLALPEPSGAAMSYFGSRGIVQLLQGEYPEWAAPMDTEWPLPTMDAAWNAWLAVVMIGRGNTEQAAASIRHLDAEALTALPRDPYWPSIVWLLSLAFDALADRGRAAVLYQLAVPFADIVVVDLGATFLGSMSHHLGTLATTAGDAVAARQHLQAAITTHTRLGADSWAANSKAALERVSEGSRRPEC
jgi:tetratricopeptide (TPR) repeat protein